jgi:hypothetical protein
VAAAPSMLRVPASIDLEVLPRLVEALDEVILPR